MEDFLDGLDADLPSLKKRKTSSAGDLFAPNSANGGDCAGSVGGVSQAAFTVDLSPRDPSGTNDDSSADAISLESSGLDDFFDELGGDSLTAPTSNARVRLSGTGVVTAPSTLPSTARPKPRITNVAAVCSIGTDVDLKHIGLHLDKSVSLEYSPGKFPAIIMRQRLPLKVRRVRGRPDTYHDALSFPVTLFAKGKMNCVGARHEEQARKALRMYARKIQLLDYDVRFRAFRVTNISATADLGFAVALHQLAYHREHAEHAFYETELAPGLLYRTSYPDPAITMTIFASGKMNFTGAQSPEEIYTIFAKMYDVLAEPPFRANLSAGAQAEGVMAPTPSGTTGFAINKQLRVPNFAPTLAKQLIERAIVESGAQLNDLALKPAAHKKIVVQLTDLLGGKHSQALGSVERAVVDCLKTASLPKDFSVVFKKWLIKLVTEEARRH